MSRLNSDDNPPDIYVGLLIVSISALFVACIMLALELQSYGWQVG